MNAKKTILGSKKSNQKGRRMFMKLKRGDKILFISISGENEKVCCYYFSIWLYD